MGKGVALVLGTVAVAGLAGGIAYAASRRGEEVGPLEDVLCEARYCASIGGANEPVENVQVAVASVRTGESLFTGSTDSGGQLQIELAVNEQYDIAVVHELSGRTTRLTYRSGHFLLVCVDLPTAKIASVDFVTAAPPVPGEARLELVDVRYGSPADFAQGSSHTATITVKNTGDGSAVIEADSWLSWYKEVIWEDRDIGPVTIPSRYLAAGSQIELSVPFTIPATCPTGGKKHKGEINYDGKVLPIPQGHAFDVVEAGAKAAEIDYFIINPTEAGVGEQVTVACKVVSAVGGLPVAGVTVVFYDWTDDREIFRAETNEDGYMGKYWYPDAESEGDNEYYVYTMPTDDWDEAVSDRIEVRVLSGSALELVSISYA